MPTNITVTTSDMLAFVRAALLDRALDFGIDIASDRIDSSEIDRAIADLSDERDAFVLEYTSEVERERGSDGTSYGELADLQGQAEQRWASENPVDAALLAALEKIAKEGEAEIADWSYGQTLIAVSDFVSYAEELAVDCDDGTLIKLLDAQSWPLRHAKIDWEAAARDLRHDYTEIEILGETFLGLSS